MESDMKIKVTFDKPISAARLVGIMAVIDTGNGWTPQTRLGMLPISSGTVPPGEREVELPWDSNVSGCIFINELPGGLTVPTVPAFNVS